MSDKTQRLRDPVHGLISFSEDKLEQLIWRLLNTPEFQRLRRIKQLGFSDLVYPGATHTRFSHSVGVFHTARNLVQLTKKLLEPDDFSPDRAKTAICAALLHDIGHGPFSHTFESVVKAHSVKKKHEHWTVDIIRGSTEVGRVLQGFDPDLRSSVAHLLSQENPTDIYSSIVASQFDADRLDYLRRDKLMTGTEQGGFDWEWLLGNLEIGTLTIGGDSDDTPYDVESFILNSKGLQAAESYLLGRFHLYTQVYLHKTTRGAEKLLEKLLIRTSKLCSRTPGSAGLSKEHPLRVFFSDSELKLESYLALDDSVIWASLNSLGLAKDPVISELAQRLQRRDLYKCLDVGAQSAIAGGDSVARFRKLLGEARDAEEFDEWDVLEDRVSVSAYKIRDYESPDALSKITIRRADNSGNYEDVANISNIVGSLKEEKLFRVYARNNSVKAKLEKIWEEAKYG